MTTQIRIAANCPNDTQVEVEILYVSGDRNVQVREVAKPETGSA